MLARNILCLILFIMCYSLSGLLFLQVGKASSAYANPSSCCWILETKLAYQQVKVRIAGVMDVVHRPEIKILENTTFLKLDPFSSSSKGWETTTLLVLLKRANLNHYTGKSKVVQVTVQVH
jgi:hypothetical protein